MLHRPRPAVPVVVAVVVVMFVGLLAYGFALRLPLFLDDMVHFRWLAWHDLPSIWSSARSLGYYRPLPFTIWRILASVQGRYDPLTLHALSLGLHLLNALLVLALVAPRGRRRGLLLGVSSAVLFLLYPFSYQAVPWVGSLTHPLVTALILGSLLLFEVAGRKQSKGLAVASMGLALVAPLAHETGLLVAPLLLLLLLTAERPPPMRKVLRQSLPYWLCAAFGLAVWLLAPKEVGRSGLLDLPSRWQNAVYFAQGLAYPASPLATRLAAGTARLDDLGAIALVSFPVILSGALLYGWAGGRRLAALALGWFVLAVLPAWLVLGFWYVVDGPRLLYEASVGAALFWAIPADLHWPGRRSIAGAGLAALVVLGAAFGGYWFIRERAPLYEQMQLAVAQLLEVRGEPGETLLCVNYPGWLAPLQPTFAVGHEGVTLVPAYTRVTDLVWLHTGEERKITTVVLPDLLQHWRYHYSCAGTTETGDSIQEKLRAAQRVIIGSYGDRNVTVREAGALERENSLPAEAYVAGFDGRVALLASTWERRGSDIRVELHWQCWETLAAETTVFVHLYDEAGQLVSQADGYPLLGTSRPIFWRPGDEWRDVRWLRLPEGVAPGRYAVKAGLYEVDGGRRPAALDGTGRRFQDDAVPIANPMIPE